MLGYVILLISLFLYTKSKYRYLSIFLYLSYMMGYLGGFGVWNDIVLGCKTMDLALLYTAAINAYLIFNKQWCIPKKSFRKSYVLFGLFLCASILFSHFHYGLTFFQILQGGRSFFMILALPILYRVKYNDLIKILRLLFWVCFIESIIYILQILVGRPLLPYLSEFSYDLSTGLVRLYNSPANLVFFIIISFIKPDFCPKNLSINTIRGVLLVALLCTLGRTNIATGIGTLLLAMMINGSFKKVAKTLIILGICLIPFIGSLSSRFKDGGTTNDLEQIVNGDFGKNYQLQDDATMTFRLAICYERGDYLAQRSLGEKIFGMGLVSDSQPWVLKHYRFRIGLINDETGETNQLGNPDIAYGNLITYLGFGGMLLYLYMCYSFARYFWDNRKKHYLYMIVAAQMIMLFVGSFSGAGLSNPQNLSLFFLILSLGADNKAGMAILNRPITKANICRNIVN